MRLLVLDNYDSFTFNLVHILRADGADLDVRRNDEIALADIALYDKILISPGPGIPSEAGVLPELLRTYSTTKDIFGVCLGLQAIGESFGGTLHNLERVMHGVATPVRVVEEDVLFRNVPEQFMAGRYHSWVVNREGLPECLTITAVDEKGFIMGLHHKTLRIRGVQFHPESVLTEHGTTMVLNWLHN